MGRTVTLRRGSVEAAGRGNVETTEALTIVGIVPGTTQDILDLEYQTQIYLPYRSRLRAAMILHVRVAEQADETAMLPPYTASFAASTTSYRFRPRGR